MPEVGELVTETLVVDPYSGSTAATVTVTAPDATTSTPIATSTDGGHTWTAVVHYIQIGIWHLAWAITGTGEGVRTRSLYIDAPYALAPWAPDRPVVADYVPGRTLAGNTVRLTFDDTTRPTGDQVDRLIGAAVAWVLVPIGPVLHESLYPIARATAAVRAAAFVELGYPTRPEDLTTAEKLFAQAERMRKDLADKNEVLTGTDGDDPLAQLLPIWAFPRPSRWGDLDL